MNILLFIYMKAKRGRHEPRAGIFEPERQYFKLITERRVRGDSTALTRCVHLRSVSGSPPRVEVSITTLRRALAPAPRR